MQTPLQLTFRGMSTSPALETEVRRRASKLERHFPHVHFTNCHVLIESVNSEQKLGRIYRVRIDLTIPGTEISATRESGLGHEHWDVHVALRDAFLAVMRQLEAHYGRRHDAKRHAHG